MTERTVDDQSLLSISDCHWFNLQHNQAFLDCYREDIIQSHRVADRLPVADECALR